MVLSLMSHISHIMLSHYVVEENVINAQNDDESGVSIFCHTLFLNLVTPNQQTSRQVMERKLPTVFKYFRS